MCSMATEKAMILSAIDQGLDAIVITDHHRLVPPKHLARLNEQYAPFKILSGLEITLTDTYEDVLVLGIQDSILETKNFTYVELHHLVKKKNGFMVLCHPFRWSDHISKQAKRYPPDGIELYSTNIAQQNIPHIIEFRERYGSWLLANSDAHKEWDIGLYYNELSQTVHTEKDLLECLRHGQYKLCADMKRQGSWIIGRDYP